MRHRVVAQEGGIQAGVEMEGEGIGIGGGRHVAVRRHETVAHRHHGGGGQVFVAHPPSLAMHTQPVGHGGAIQDGRPELAEAVEKAVAEVAPVLELDAELEARLRLADELRVVELERVVVVADGGQRGLADADSADLRRLDQDDLATRGVVAAAQQLAKRRGSHPARRATADDDDAPNGLVAKVVVHALSLHPLVAPPVR
jgi:hypothetical protein